MLQKQLQEVRLQDKVGKQNYRHETEKLFEPVTDTKESTSEILTKTITESSIKNNEAFININNKLLEIMIDRGMLASNLISLLCKITNP